MGHKPLPRHLRSAVGRGVLAGLGAHGEAPVAARTSSHDGDVLIASAHFPIAGSCSSAGISLRDSASSFGKTVTNIAATDRTIGWTEHVTLGPPFLEPGSTQFRASAHDQKYSSRRSVPMIT
jgi:hypothetical protein